MLAMSNFLVLSFMLMLLEAAVAIWGVLFGVRHGTPGHYSIVNNHFQPIPQLLLLAGNFLRGL